MDFSFTEEQKTFRKEVRQFLEDEIKAGVFESKSNNFMETSSPEFSRRLSERGWIGITWPKKYGGSERSYIDRAILMEELLRYQAPMIHHFVGERQMGPALMHFGTEEQINEFLPKIINAEISFCIGMSEPGAGSDVAAVSTVAREEGDYLIINGQKTWTSNAHKADYVWLLTKTDPDAPKYKNLSEILVDLKLPGIKMNPVYNVAGMHSFNDVFFDNVKVHKKYLVGKPNRGFYQMLSQVDYERAGFERLMQNYPLFDSLRTYVKENKASDHYAREEMAQLEIEYHIGRLLCYQVAWTIDQGKIPNREAAISKAYCTRFEQKLGEVATLLAGQYGHIMPSSLETPMDGAAAESFIWNPSYTIQGGASEVLKGVIATRGLGLTFKKK